MLAVTSPARVSGNSQDLVGGRIMLVVTSPARVSGNSQDLVRLLLSRTHKSKDTCMRHHLVRSFKLL